MSELWHNEAMRFDYEQAMRVTAAVQQVSEAARGLHEAAQRASAAMARAATEIPPLDVPRWVSLRRRSR